MLCALLCAACNGGGGDAPAAPAPPRVEYHPNGVQIPVAGPDVPGAAAFDQGVMQFMRQWNVPGAAIAVAKDGRLRLARGYGYADFETRQPAQPDSMFRIGSASKILTAMAVLRLRDRGQLDLDQTFVSILTEYQAATGDARLSQITLRQTLRHSGGWDRGVAPDLLFETAAIARTLDVPAPVSSADVVRYTTTQPLQFAPGTRFAYSNVGFTILGRVIERVSGQSYESYVREQVLAPLGVHAMSIGGSHLAERGPFEVKYYAEPGDTLVESEFPGEGNVPRPYRYDLSRLDSAGGWIASAIDLTRVIAAYDSSLTPGFLSADSLTQALSSPPYAGSGGLNFPGSTWYGFALSVGPTTESYGHGGALPGTAASVVHHANGYSVAVLLNTQGGSEPLYYDVVPMVTQALGSFPDAAGIDLYPQYPSPSLPARGP